MRPADFPVYNRRHFLKHLAGLSLMAAPGMQFVRTLRAAAPELQKQHKSIIILWMSGGPSHMDIWDMKPESSNGGQFKPIKTAVSGIEICEHMPHVAQQMKHLSLIRSLVTNEGSHERGRVLLHTGRQPTPAIAWPSLGAVASQQLTARELALPGFIAIGRPSEGPGFLGMNYAPFTVQNPGQPPENVRTPTEVDDHRIQRRRQLFHAVEENFQASLAPHLGPLTDATESRFAARGDASQAHRDIYKKAFSLVAARDKKVFELAGEKAGTLAEYGNSAFGRGCLLARRLVEAGVTCVEVDLGGWDNHSNIFPALHNTQGTGRLDQLDKGMGALVKDLVDRGLWQNTVVVWMGEFGRTPKINQNAGRDHWARCWSVALGGGALKGGIVYGSTNTEGTEVQDNPVTTLELFATLYQALGIDPTLQIRDQIGRPHYIAGDGKPAEPVKALF